MLFECKGSDTIELDQTQFYSPDPLNSIWLIQFGYKHSITYIFTMRGSYKD